MDKVKLEMIEAKAGAILDIGMANAYSPYVLLVLAEEALELAAEVRRLEGRLQAVCDVLSDADAFDGVVDPETVMEAVRGYRQATLIEVKARVGPVVDDAAIWEWITHWKARVMTDGTLVIDDLTGLFAEMSGLRD